MVHLGEGVWLAAARRGSGGGGLRLYRSTDDAATWTDLGAVTTGTRHPGDLLQLRDGRIVLAYGNRAVSPRFVEAMISNDQGTTWSAPVTLASWSGDGGYPASVERADGKIVTAFYGAATPYHSGYHVGAVIWEVDKLWDPHPCP